MKSRRRVKNVKPTPQTRPNIKNSPENKEKKSEEKREKQGLFGKIFGNLRGGGNKKVDKSLDRETVQKIKEDQEGRIPLVFDKQELPQDSSPVGSLFRQPRKKDNYTSEKQRELAKKAKERRFQVIRQENDDYRPLHELNIWNKIRTAKRYRDEKSGKIAEKEAAKRRKLEEQKIKIESKLKREITEITDRIVEGEMDEAVVEITVQPEHIDCLERVLLGDYFAMFNIEQRKPNKNLKIYGIFPPISLRFKRNLKRNEI